MTCWLCKLLNALQARYCKRKPPTVPAPLS